MKIVEDQLKVLRDEKLEKEKDKIETEQIIISITDLRKITEDKLDELLKDKGDKRKLITKVKEAVQDIEQKEIKRQWEVV